MDRYLRLVSCLIADCKPALDTVISDIGSDITGRIIARYCDEDPELVTAEDQADSLGFTKGITAHALTTVTENHQLLRRYLSSLRFRVEYLVGLFQRIQSQSDYLRTLYGPDAVDGFIRIGMESLSRVQRCIEYLVSSNQRLVMAIAKQYQHGAIEYMDLIQEGNIGLLRAIERFDPDRHTRLTTYALWWVRRAMVYNIARSGHVVRAPVSLFWEARRIARTLNQLEIILGHKPSASDAINELCLSSSYISDARAILSRPLSLDAPIAHDSDVTHQDMLAASPERDPIIDSIHEEHLSSVVCRLLEEIPERHANILRMRFGIGVYSPCTLEEIAKQQGVTRERIRQIEVQAMNILRRTISLELLADCLS